MSTTARFNDDGPDGDWHYMEPNDIRWSRCGRYVGDGIASWDDRAPTEATCERCRALGPGEETWP